MDPLKNMQPGYNGRDNLEQFQSKIDRWNLLLNTRKLQNVSLKEKLSDILKNRYNEHLLDDLEKFQTKFVGEDIVIDSLRIEVRTMEDLLVRLAEKNGAAKSMMNASMKKLENDISESTARFRSLKAAFNEFQQKIFCKRT